MKATELRIGNYYDQFGNIEQVSWPIIRDLTITPDGQLWCNPIPLTEEWLVKFGFKKMNVTFGVEFHIKICDTDFYLRPAYVGGFYWGFSPSDDLTNIELNDVNSIQYVHQLQNLYYALTGEELI